MMPRSLSRADRALASYLLLDIGAIVMLDHVAVVAVHHFAGDVGK
jgi:hypothetical protein